MAAWSFQLPHINRQEGKERRYVKVGDPNYQVEESLLFHTGAVWYHWSTGVFLGTHIVHCDEVSCTSTAAMTQELHGDQGLRSLRD